MEELKSKIEKLAEKFPYLKEIRSTKVKDKDSKVKVKHIEVTDEAIGLYKTKYDYLKGYTVYESKAHRNQMSPPGAWLHKEQEGAIDIVGDVLTSESAFKFIDDENEQETKRLYLIFQLLYHSIGNLLPIGEGGNLGTIPFGYGGTNDTFSRKLYYIKQIFDNETGNTLKEYDYEVEDESIAKKIEDRRYVGKGKNRIHYWICSEWNPSKYSWNDFVQQNYLFEMIDEVENPIYWGKSEFDWELGEKTDEELNDIIANCIRMIIYRGYRVWNKTKNDLDSTAVSELNEILNELDLNKYFENECKC